jgi:hypothetical protein
MRQVGVFPFGRLAFVPFGSQGTDGFGNKGALDREKKSKDGAALG